MASRPFAGPGRHRPHNEGFTLLEVLIALVVLSIGVLGMVALQTAALQFNTSAYHRSQATALAYDMADRMRANRNAALLNNVYSGVDFQDPPPACGELNIGGTIVQQDIATWRNALACALPQGTGRIQLLANDVVVITVQWDDSRGEQAPQRFEVMTSL